MLKEVRRYEWEEFLSAVKTHYGLQAYDVEVTPRLGTEGFRTFLLRGRADGSERTLDNPTAYGELAGILFPGKDVSVLSVYKPKEPFLGSDVIYVAVESAGGEPDGR